MVGVGVKVPLASRCLTLASTVALISAVGGAGDPGTAVGRSGAAALEQRTMNAVTAMTAKIVFAKARCFAIGIEILSTPMCLCWYPGFVLRRSNG